MSTERAFPRPDENDPSASGNTGVPEAGIVRIPLWAACVITGLAVVLIAIHLAIPALRIDAVTLVLLGVAALPWAGPLIRNARFGPFELNQLRVLHRTVKEINARIEEVRQLVVTGGTPEQQIRIETEVTLYSAYLSRIGIAGEGANPTVRVVYHSAEMSPGMVSEYRDGTVFILADYADRPTVALREYTHHMLHSFDRLPSIQDAPGRLIESGLAYYLPCSFTDNSHFGRLAGSHGEDDDTSYLHDISQPGEPAGRRAPALERYGAGGRQWAYRLWGLRALAGPATADPVLISAWFDTDLRDNAEAAKAFIAAVCSRLPDEHAEPARRILTRSARQPHAETAGG